MALLTLRRPFQTQFIVRESESESESGNRVNCEYGYTIWAIVDYDSLHQLK